MRQKGFTLLELIVALSIAALFLGIAVPSFTSFLKNSAQVTSANELLSTLHYARDFAITKQVRVTVCPSSSGTDCSDVGWNPGWIVFLDTNGNQAVDVGETIERATVQVGTPSVESDAFEDFLIFRPNGRAMAAAVTDNSGEFTFCDARGAEHARVLIVETSGRPRVSTHAMDGGAPTCPSPG